MRLRQTPSAANDEAPGINRIYRIYREEGLGVPACCQLRRHRVKVTLIIISPCPRQVVAILLGATHCTSCNIQSLTAHVAYTAVSNLLISLQCYSYPSRAHSKINAQKTVFSRSSSLSSSVSFMRSTCRTIHFIPSLYAALPLASIRKPVKRREDPECNPSYDLWTTLCDCKLSVTECF
jgi:hypothetical protein